MRALSSLLILPVVALLASAAAPDLSSRAKANLSALVSDADYPPSALRAHVQGTVEFQLDVAADGHVSACRVTTSSGSPILDDATCRIMVARARFVPAHDRKGRPIPDRVHNRLRWVLPDEAPAEANQPPPDETPPNEDTNQEAPADPPPS